MTASCHFPVAKKKKKKVARSEPEGSGTGRRPVQARHALLLQ